MSGPAGPYVFGDDRARRRRLLPGGGRGIADALAQTPFMSLPYRELAEPDNPTGLEEVPIDYGPDIAPRGQAAIGATRLSDLSDEVELPRNAPAIVERQVPGGYGPGGPTTRSILEQPDYPHPEAGETALGVTHPMEVARQRAVLSRIAAGKRSRPDGTPYTPEERRQAEQFATNLRAVTEAQDAQRGFGRSVANELTTIGSVNRPYRRIEQAANEAGVPSPEALRSLDVVGHDEAAVRTTPTMREALLSPEGAGTLVGQLPFFAAASPFEAAGLARTGLALERSAPSISRGIASLLEEGEGATFLERTGQRAARGAVFGQPSYAALDVTQRAAAGESPGDIAKGVPLDLALGAATGAVAEPLFGAVRDAVRPSGRPGTQLDAAMADRRVSDDGAGFARERRLSRAQQAATQMDQARPSHQANAVHQMQAEMEIHAAVNSERQHADAEAARAETEAQEQQARAPVAAVVDRAKEHAQDTSTPEGKAAQDYLDSINKFFDANTEYRRAPAEEREAGTKKWADFARAEHTLNETRMRYGRMIGALSLIALASNKENLTDEEKAAVGLATVPFALPGGEARFAEAEVRRIRTVVDGLSTGTMRGFSALDWANTIGNQAGLTGEQTAHIRDLLADHAVGRPTTDMTEGQRNSFVIQPGTVKAALRNILPPEVGERPSQFSSRLVNFINSRPDEMGRGGLPKKWDNPTPADQWLSKLRGSSEFTKAEFKLLEPSLAQAASDKRQLTRAEVAQIAQEVVPRVERVRLHDEERGQSREELPTNLPAVRPAMLPLAEVERRVAAGAITRNEVGHQILLHNEAVQPIVVERDEITHRLHPEVDDTELRAAEDAKDDAETEMNEAYHRANNAAPDDAVTTVMENIDRGADEAVRKAMEGVDIDYEPPDYDPEELLRDNGYKIDEEPGEWVVYAEPAPTLSEGDSERRELARYPNTYTEPNPHYVGVQREEFEAGREVEHTEASVLEQFHRDHPNAAPEISVEREPEQTVLRNSDDEEIARGDDFDAIRDEAYEEIRDHDLDQELNDEAYREAEEVIYKALKEYAEALEAYNEAEGIHYNLTEDRENNPPEANEDLDEGEATALAARQGELTRQISEYHDTHNRLHELSFKAPDRLALPATTEGGADADLKPITLPVHGPTKWSTYQRIGGGEDYHEIALQWKNRPAGEEQYNEPHGWRSDAGPVKDAIAHLRREVHDIYEGMPDVTERRVQPRAEDSALTVERKQRIMEKRAHLDTYVAERKRAMDALQKLETDDPEAVRWAKQQHDGEHLSDEQGRRVDALVAKALPLRDRYIQANQRVIDIAAEESKLIAYIAAERGVAPKKVLVALELQSRYAADAANEGLRGAADPRLEAERQRLTAEKDALDNKMMALVEPFRNRVLEYNTAHPDGEQLYRAISNYGDYGPADADLATLREKAPDLAEVVEEQYMPLRERYTVIRERITALPEPEKQGIPRSPFLTGSGKKMPGGSFDVDTSGPYRADAAALLAEGADTNHETIAWSDADNRINNAMHLGDDNIIDAMGNAEVARRIYDNVMPKEIKFLLKLLGFPEVPVEHGFIRGHGHWLVKLTPEMRRAIRKYGVPILALTAMVTNPDTAKAQDTTGVSETEGGDEGGHPIRNATLAAIGASGLAWAALTFAKRHPRLPMLREPEVEAALALTRRASTEERAMVTRGRSVREARGTAYDAPLDVSETRDGRGPALLNLAKMGVALSDEGGQIMREVTDRLAMQKRHVSWGETKAVAAQRAITPGELLNQKPWTGADALAARMFQKESVDRISALAKEAQRPLVAQSDLDRIHATIGTLTADLGDVTRRAIGEREAAGRTLNAYKIVARTTLDPATWAMLAQRAKRLPLTPEEVTTIAGLIGKQDRAGLTQFVSGLHKSSLVDKAIEALRLGFLSSPTTVGKITASHAIHAGAQMAAHPVAMGLDALITGVRRLAGDRTAQREMALAARGTAESYSRGARAGWTSAKQALRTGVKESEEARFDIDRVRFDSPWADALQRWIYGAHALGYEPFRLGYFERVIHELSLVKARQLVKANPSLDLITVREGLRSDPTPDMMMTAMDEANHSVFQNKGSLANVANAGKRALKQGGTLGKVAAGVVTPFTTIPANVATRLVDATPLGVATAINRQTRMGFNQRRLSQDLATAFVGTGGMMLAGYMLYHLGKATGSFPDQPSKKNLWMAEGKAAAAIKIGNQWVNVSEYGPEGMALALGAAWAQATEEQPDWGDRAGSYMGAIGKTVVDVPFLSGVQTAMEAIDDPAAHGGAWAKQVTGGVVPAVVRRTAHAMDSKVRDASGPGAQIKASLPGVSKTVPQKVDAMGRPVTRSRVERGAELLSPTRISTDRSDPVTREFERLGIGIPGIPKTRHVGGASVQYDATARRNASAATGPVWRMAVVDTMLSPGYQRMDDEQKATALREIIRKVRRGYYAPQDSLRKEMANPALPVLPP